MKPEREWITSHIIKDRDGSLLKLKTASEQLTPNETVAEPTADQMLKLDAKFWNWTWNAHARIARGELWEALHVINHIRDFAIIEMQDWILQGSLEGYRRIEARLEKDLATKLGATVALCDTENLSRALVAEIKLYCELRDQMVERLDLSIDDRAEHHVLEAISHRSTSKQPRGSGRRTRSSS